MAKGTIVAKAAVTRKKGKMYFVDGDGNVREITMNRKGGKRGRKVCAAPKKKAARKKTAKKKTVKRKTAKRKTASRKRK